MYSEYTSKLNHVLSRVSDSDLKLLKDRIKNSILYYQYYDIDKVNIIKVNYYKEYGNNSKRSS